MAGILGTISTEGTEQSQLLAGDGAQLKEITLKATAGALVRGTVLAMNTTTYKWEKLVPAGSGGAEVARAILAEDAGSTNREEKAQAYFIGKYRYDDLVFTDGVTRLQEDEAIKELQDVGIVIDSDFSTAATTTSTTTSTTSSTSSTSSTTTTTAAC
jgi:hypothetical protein